MCRIRGKESRFQTKPKKRKCCERNLMEKKEHNNTRTTEIFHNLGVDETWGK